MVPNAYTEHHGTSCASQSAVCYWCAKLAAEHGWLHWVFEYWGYKWGIGFRTPCLGLNHPEDINFGTASHLSYSSSKWKYTRSISNLMLQNSTFCIQLCVHKHILVHMAQHYFLLLVKTLPPHWILLSVIAYWIHWIHSNFWFLDDKSRVNRVHLHMPDALDSSNT